MPSPMTRPTPATTPIKSPLSPRRPSISLLSRNIDSVILGSVQFDTWYYSPYSDSIVLGGSDPSAIPGRHPPHSHQPLNGAPSLATTTTTLTPTLSKTCPVLHVCPYCFRYTPLGPAYVSHLRHHQQTFAHDADALPVPASATAVYSHGGYRVWEIDGEREKLYCQNLSLFGKLFLEQKSVFFDTGEFLYYVLTFTPPERGVPKLTGRGGGRKVKAAAAGGWGEGQEEGDGDDLGLRTEVLGFFSKENPSWESNNLACILIFPPYQHRQLGKLLMSVSYKLSGWEWEGGVIGGPEKPLSVMGRRSYLRFWSERVARFMLGETADADGRRVFDQTQKRKGRRRKNTVVKEAMTVKEIGERTGMLAEDVVAALKEMGVCEGLVTRGPSNKFAGADRAEAPDDGGRGPNGTDVNELLVKRSRVVEWVQARQVNLQDPVREEGFLGEWAMSDADGDESNSDEEMNHDN